MRSLGYAYARDDKRRFNQRPFRLFFLAALASSSGNFKLGPDEHAPALGWPHFEDANRSSGWDDTHRTEARGPEDGLEVCLGCAPGRPA